jgi:hypothetical protein
MMDVKLQGVFTLPNETDKEAKKRNSKREFTSSFAHSLVKGPKFQGKKQRKKILILKSFPSIQLLTFRTRHLV